MFEVLEEMRAFNRYEVTAGTRAEAIEKIANGQHDYVDAIVDASPRRPLSVRDARIVGDAP